MTTDQAAHSAGGAPSACPSPEQARAMAETLRAMTETGADPDAIHAAADALEALASEAESRIAESAHLLRLLVDIRFALGDDGQRMQDELVEWCKSLRPGAGGSGA